MTRNLQDHILQIASELFYTQGIKTTGVDAIVKAAGTTKMSLYKYFPSKDDLVVAHLQRSRENMRLLLQSAVEAKTGQPKQQLLAVFEVFEALQANPSFRGCPFINASAEFAAESSPVQQAAAEFSESFRQMLAQLASAAGISNAEELSKQLSMLIGGAMVREQMQRQSGAMQTARAAAEILIDNSLTLALPTKK